MLGIIVLKETCNTSNKCNNGSKIIAILVNTVITAMIVIIVLLVLRVKVGIMVLRCFQVGSALAPRVAVAPGP